MSRFDSLVDRLERASDRLSPLVVKEVRQAVRGREFHYSFEISLLFGLAIAFTGAADALGGGGTSGSWTFSALMGGLTLLGMVVVPLGTFSALRNERLEQTLELITLTALSPRRVVVGKLLAQGVKLATLFAGLAPFMAMCFLLGGIDFATILISLPLLFMWSMWACAACLFLSSLFATRAMSGAAFGAVGVVMFLLLVVFGLPRLIFMVVMASRGGGAFSGAVLGFGGPGLESWWVLAIATTVCIATMVNLVLLAENRLSLPTEDRVTAVRVGFFVQFLLIVAWTLAFIGEPEPARSSAARTLGVLASLHLAGVAMFAVTEDLVVSRRVLLGMHAGSRWRRLPGMFRPGGGRGAVYVLAQMAILLAAAWMFQPASTHLRWFVAACGFICFFTGVPAAFARYLKPAGAASFPLRVVVLVLLCIALVLPDVLYYLLWQPGVLDLAYARRHLLNPMRTLANWTQVETELGASVPFIAGSMGLLAYVVLIHLGRRVTVAPTPLEPHDSPAAAVEPGSAGIIY